MPSIFSPHPNINQLPCAALSFALTNLLPQKASATQPGLGNKDQFPSDN